jgi:hypothetical protein
MKSSKISHRVWLVAGTALLTLSSATPSVAAATNTGDGCCNTSQADSGLTRSENPYTYEPSPLGLQGLTSTDQNAEEGTLNQGSAQVDAEVGASEHEVADVPTTARDEESVNWIVQGVAILLSLAIVSVGIRFIFYPSDRIPRIGRGGSAL